MKRRTTGTPQHQSTATPHHRNARQDRNNEQPDPGEDPREHHRRRPLTVQDAEALVGAARAAAEAAGVTVAVSVLDAGGHLLAFRRDDRAVLIAGETSTRKAYTALQWGTPTADLVYAVQPGGLFHTLPTALDRPLRFIAGGVPVHRDGRLVGAIGVGGGAPEQDHGFAGAAVTALGRGMAA